MVVRAMETFYKQEDLEVFRKWVYYQVASDPRLKLEKYDSRTYKIYYKNRVARFVVWPIGIVEEAIMEGEELLFYLHYQFYNFHYATNLFHHMMEKLLEDEKPNYHILLCCSGGMTTGYFAEKLNKYCQLNHLPYHIDATAVYQLENVYQKYDLILIAPQLRYKQHELSQKLKPVLVDNIDASIFATYDCQAMIEHIEKIIKDENK